MLEYYDGLGSGKRSMSEDDKYWCRVLDNIEVSPTGVQYFLNSLNLKDKIDITFSNRKNVRRFGTCWPKSRRIILYRHSAGTLVHEIAHIKEFVLYGDTGHTKRFNEVLRGLTKQYVQLYPNVEDDSNYKR